MSRTTPTKLAIAPIFGLLRRMAVISAPESKSSACTRTVTSASGDRRKKRNLVALANRRIRCGHLLVHGDAHRFARCKFALPRFSTAAQPFREACNRVYMPGQL